MSFLTGNYSIYLWLWAVAHGFRLMDGWIPLMVKCTFTLLLTTPENNQLIWDLVVICWPQHTYSLLTLLRPCN